MALLLVLSINQSAFAYTQKTFIYRLLANNKFFEQELIDVKISKINMDSTASRYGDWNLDFSAEMGLNKQDVTKHDFTDVSGYVDDTDKKTRKISFESSKQFFSNGSRLNLSLSESFPIVSESFSDESTSDATKDNSNENISNASVVWSLPLLRNKNGVIDKNSYDMSILDFEDAKLSLAEIQEDFVSDKMLEFIGWVSFNWQIKMYEGAIATLRELRGKTSPDHKREISIFTKKIKKYKRKVSRLKSKLKAQTGVLISAVNSIDVIKNPPTLKREVDVDLVKDMKKYAQENIRVLKRLDIETRANNRKIKTYKSEQLGNLDLTLSAFRNEDIDDSTSYSKSVTNEYEAKIVFSYPLSGNIDVQTDLSTQLLRNQQIEMRYNNRLKNILSNAKVLDNNISYGLEHLETLKAQMKELQVLDEPYLNFHGEGQGRGEARFVISELDDYLDVQKENIETLIDLYKDKLSYDNLLDRLLPN